MTKTKIILSVIALAAAAIPTVMYVSYVGSTEELVKNHSDIDPMIVRKVSKEMFFESLRGEYNNVVDDSDGSTGEYDKIFFAKVAKLTSK
jgi:hypothetical protein